MAGEAGWVCKVVEGRLAVDAHVSKKRFPWFVSHTLKVIRQLYAQVSHTFLHRLGAFVCRIENSKSERVEVK